MLDRVIFMAQTPKQDFVYRKHMSIGEVDAENDHDFLAECFIDNGDLSVLEDTTKSQCIVLGRTGSGKSALLERLESHADNIIRVEPEELALRHISNSTILGLFEDLGVKLDIFYNLLWQHTFAVELIRHKYSIDCEETNRNFFATISEIISGDSKKKQALAYIEEWGDKFWASTEERIKEFTEILEKRLETSVKLGMPEVSLSTSGIAALTEEQKTEIVNYGKKVVSTVQIEKLSKIVALLAEDIFTDEYQKTYILIDRLDENWVEDKLRYKLIRALIETIRKFRNIKPVKIVVTLRTDLLDRVLEHTQDSGFQREKYQNLFLSIIWKKTQLKKLLDSRINRLLKHKYTNSEVDFEDVFPGKLDKVSSLEYVLDRTLLRPRDAIMFVNECLIEAQDTPMISAAIMKLAEKTYSASRLESLQYEWFVEHPLLSTYIGFLHHKTHSFKVNAVTEDDTILFVNDVFNHVTIGSDIVVVAAKDYMNSNYPESSTHIARLKQNLLYVLYKVGVIGLKLDGTSTVKWVQDRTQDVSPARIEPLSIVYIHKMLWRCLAIDKR